MYMDNKKLKNIIRESILAELGEDGSKFKVTIEWIQNRYNKANQELFNGRLGACNFKIADLGVRTNGRFTLDTPSDYLYYNPKANNHLYVVPYVGANRIYINKENFVKYCNPTIFLNSNRSATEESRYATLVHEMCHYYTYMFGFVPKQAHGREFRDIASIIAYRSNNTITVKRLASAEQMEGYELDADVKAKRTMLDAKKKMRREMQSVATNYYISLSPNNTIRLFKVDNAKLLSEIVEGETDRGCEMFHITDGAISHELYINGYKAVSRKYSFWTIPFNNKLIQKVLNSSSTEAIN